MRHVPAQRVVELEPSVISQPHDRDGGERLGDRRDAVRLAGLPQRTRPVDRAVARGPGHETGQPGLLPNLLEQGPAGVGGWFGHASVKADGSGQLQTRLRSPYAWSIRATGGQYLSTR